MKGREATAAHPLCTCREHDHKLDADYCVGSRLYFRAMDGGVVQGTCRVMGGIEPRTRDACLMHGKPVATRPGDRPAGEPAPALRKGHEGSSA